MFTYASDFSSIYRIASLIPLFASCISGHFEDNILTRAIAGRNDLLIAKEILKRKFVVGLYDHTEESIRRFEWFLGWNNIGDGARTCQHEEVQMMMAAQLCL